MKLIHRYLLRDILHYFGLFALIFIAIMTVSSIFDFREDFLQNSPPLADIILFLIYSLPDQIREALPMMGLLGTLMAYGLLARNSELLAMIAAGISFRQLALPAIGFGAALSLFALWFNEEVVPASVQQAHYIEKVVIGGKNESVMTPGRNRFVKGIGDRFYFMKDYLPGRREMINPTTLDVSPDGSGLIARVDARSARLNDEKGDQRYWVFDGAEQWNFNADGSPGAYQKYDGPFEMPMEEELDKFLGTSQKPEEMNLPELMNYVKLVDRRGGEDVDPYRTAIYLKMAFPLTCLLMSLLGFVAGADPRKARFAVGAFMGLIVAVGYYMLEATMSSLGNHGHLAPMLAGWSAVCVFAAIVVLLARRLQNLQN